MRHIIYLPRFILKDTRDILDIPQSR
jgi:hypothetical protein